MQRHASLYNCVDKKFVYKIEFKLRELSDHNILDGTKRVSNVTFNSK